MRILPYLGMWKEIIKNYNKYTSFREQSHRASEALSTHSVCRYVSLSVDKATPIIEWALLEWRSNILLVIIIIIHLFIFRSIKAHPIKSKNSNIRYITTSQSGYCSMSVFYICLSSRFLTLLVLSTKIFPNFIYYRNITYFQTKISWNINYLHVTNGF